MLDRRRSTTLLPGRSDLGMQIPLTGLLNPDLGGLVEALQGEIGPPLQHRHQAAFQGCPKGFLLGVLILMGSNP